MFIKTVLLLIGISLSCGLAYSSENYSMLPPPGKRVRILGTEPLCGKHKPKSGKNELKKRKRFKRIAIKRGVYKTEFCLNSILYGNCDKMPWCTFAHGPDELRERLRGFKYKTELCDNYRTNRWCRFGHRCHFIHPGDDQTLLDGIFNPDIFSRNEKHLSQIWAKEFFINNSIVYFMPDCSINVHYINNAENQEVSQPVLLPVSYNGCIFYCLIP